jgi:Domain of unknown function (DUF5666)
MSMSSDGQNEVPNESQGPEQGSGYDAGYGDSGYGDSGYGTDPGAEPTAQFDAFRARQAQEREQQRQEMQTGYTFPPDYAADPGTVFVPPMAAAPPPGTGGRGRKTRSLLIFGGAVLVACVLGLGAWLAFSSSSSSTNTASTGAAATPTAASTGTATDAAKRALTFRVTIASVGSGSFTGKVLADGDSVTVAITSDTRFGTKAHAFTQSELTVGETVIVRGKPTGTGTITATEVAANVAKTTKTKSTATATPAA